MQLDVNTVLTIVGVNIAMMAFVGAFILWAFNKLDSDIKSLGAEIKADNTRRDNLIMQTNARMDGVYNILLKRTENLNG